MNKSEIIEKFFKGTSFLVRGKKYPAPLPAELADWYCYTSDGGHSILVLIEGEFDEEKPVWQELCPAPVKAVLRDYRAVGEFIAAKLKYDSEIGLISDWQDEEF
jgi:hypothetical protein